jgi:hypothetical protein
LLRSFSIVKPPVTEGEGEEEGKELDMVREEEEEETVNPTKPALVKYTDIRQAETESIQGCGNFVL